jgi:hypothetical protein
MGAGAVLLAQAFRRGLRLLRQDLAFTILAVGLLGIGQAASITVLAAYDAVIVRPLPYPHPDQLAFIWSTRTTSNQGVGLSPTAIPDFVEWQRRARTVSLGSFLYAEMHVGGSRLEPEITRGARVSTDLFAVVGVPPAQGRLFRPEEGQAGFAHRRPPHAIRWGGGRTHLSQSAWRASTPDWRERGSRFRTSYLSVRRFQAGCSIRGVRTVSGQGAQSMPLGR